FCFRICVYTVVTHCTLPVTSALEDDEHEEQKLEDDKDSRDYVSHATPPPDTRARVSSASPFPKCEGIHVKHTDLLAN
nr:hypothetical protein [Tanacetum cinerariifolium]